MFQVRNKGVLRLLANRQMKVSRQRNGIAIGAIMLTTILFSTLFTIGGGVLEQARQSLMRTGGGTAQMSVKFLSMPEYEQLKEAGGYEKIGYSIITGTGAHESLQKLKTEVRYAEDYSAQTFMGLPTEGHMPEEKTELATSRLVLEAMGLPDEIGSRIIFPIDVGGTVHEDTFTLCGIWDGDPIVPAQQAWISKSYSEEIAPTLTTHFDFEKNTSYEGSVMADVDFSNVWNLRGKGMDLLQRADLPEDVTWGINPMYSELKPDFYTILTGVILLTAIFVSGYLIIYNVFYISVNQDIRFYGLLKTIGSSGKQLRRIVLRQAMLLSAAGIPAGLLAGYDVGKVMLPFVVSQFAINELGDYKVSPIVLVGAAVFSLLTVYISFRAPGRIAASVSPVEAVHYTGDGRRKSKRKRRKHQKQNNRQGEAGAWSVRQKDAPMTLAFRSLRRDGKKAVLVILSLFLSMTLLNTTYTILQGFDLERYVKTQTNGDFEVTDWTIASSGVEKNLEGIDREFEEAVSQLHGLTRFEKVYGEQGWVCLTEEAVEWLLQEKEQGKELPYLGMAESGQDFVQAYAATGTLVEHADYQMGTFDAEKWAEGTYVVYNDSVFGWGLYPEPLYKPGDKIALEGKDGQKKEYTVMAVGTLPYTLTVRQDTNLGFTVILPEQEFVELYGEKQPLSVVYDVEKPHREEAEMITARLIENSNKVCISFETLKAEFRQTKRAYSLIGGIMSAILGAIGILNFINIIVTGIFTRQKELAMLSAVGMGGRQMKRMLVWESAAYIGTAAVLTVTAGNLISWLICQDAMIQNQWAFTYHFTVLPVAVCLPILLLAGFAVPLVFYHKMCGKSVVERLRCI